MTPHTESRMFVMLDLYSFSRRPKNPNKSNATDNQGAEVHGSDMSLVRTEDLPVCGQT